MIVSSGAVTRRMEFETPPDKRMLTEAEARKLTDKINHDMMTLWADVGQAWERQAWKALGYADWSSYVNGEFDLTHLKVPKADLPSAVTMLREIGMSQRAIATATNVSQPTVQRALEAASDSDESVAAIPPKPITGVNGKKYKPKRKRKERSPKPRHPAHDMALAIYQRLQGLTDDIAKLDVDHLNDGEINLLAEHAWKVQPYIGWLERHCEGPIARAEADDAA